MLPHHSRTAGRPQIDAADWGVWASLETSARVVLRLGERRRPRVTVRRETERDKDIGGDGENSLETIGEEKIMVTVSRWTLKEG